MIKRVLKIGTRKAINTSLTQSKKLIKKNPKAARYLRNVLLNYINVEAAKVSNDRYQQWLLQNYPSVIELHRQANEAKSFSYKPLVSILVPTYNTNLNFLADCIESVFTQTYDNWELILVDDASPDVRVRESIKTYAAADSRIKYHFRKSNGHISVATNDALKIATGEYIALLDHDDILWPNALYEFIKVLSDDRSIDFLYSDEDKITEYDWQHKDVFFKPDWNPEFLQSVNYITHFAMIRKTIIEEVGGWRSKYDGAQDWDLFLRITNKTEKIRHIPKVVYSWRISATSAASGIEAKPYAIEAQREAIKESLRAVGDGDAKVVNGVSADIWTVEYPIKDSPKVSIVIPTKDQYEILKVCINSIFKKTTYSNFDIILVDTGSTDQKIERYYKQLRAQHGDVIKIHDFVEESFSYARSCNFGVQQSTGEYVLFLNNDIEVITPEWIQILLSDAQRDGIGAVGCKLYYPDRVHIQHAGIGVGLNGTAANLLSKASKNNLDLVQLLYSRTRHELTAVTAACMMVGRSKLNEVGGFDEQFRITYNDVDLCLKLKDVGYRNIFNPAAELIHHESISVGLPELLDRNDKKRDNSELEQTTRLLQTKWKKYIVHDPHVNSNLDSKNAFMQARIIEAEG